jgi:hypothetical protein
MSIVYTFWVLSPARLDHCRHKEHGQRVEQHTSSQSALVNIEVVLSRHQVVEYTSKRAKRTERS